MKDSKLKRKLVAAYEVFYEQRRLLILRTKYHLHIKNSEKTIQYILKNKCSVARFGDGEFKLMLNLADIGFQQRDVQLSERLIDVLNQKRASVLLCVPSTLNSVRGCNDFARQFWIDWGRNLNTHINVVNMLWEHCGKDYWFGDTEMTRTYIDWKTDKRAKKLFPQLKKLWDGEDVLFVEGEQTRLGVGNDLFSNARSIQRVLAPAKNAFAVYDDILRATVENGKGKLIILALGPTATVLANDLDKYGCRALDLGHIDIEYEWFKQRATTRTPISGKFTNEAKDQGIVSECLDPTYLSQIVARVGC